MAARKSRLYLNSFIPVNRTHDEIVRNIFRPGKFACTITGNLQIVGVMCICANLSLMLVSDYCHFYPCNRKLNIGSAVATICNATALYFVFCCGFAVNNPALWVRISIITNLTLSIITITCQAIGMKTCRTITHVQKSPGPIALVGGGCLLLSSGCLFILYRYKEIDDHIIEITQIAEDRHHHAGGSRKSSTSSRYEDGRKRSNSSVHSDIVHGNSHHIKGCIYVKRDDGRRISAIGRHEDINGAKRKLSVYDNRGYAIPVTHNVHHHKRKCSTHAGIEEDFPHCFHSKRKNSLFAKHI